MSFWIFKTTSNFEPNLVRDINERPTLKSKHSTSERLGVETILTLKRVRADMKLTANVLERAPKKGSDAIRFYLSRLREVLLWYISLFINSELPFSKADFHGILATFELRERE